MRILTHVLAQFRSLFAGRRPAGTGAPGGRFAPPPRTPNCVSSQCDPADAGHYIAPLAFGASPGEAWNRLVVTVKAMERVNVVAERPGYLHAECSSRLLGFVDDLECLLDAPSGVIHVRSASRLGSSDFGVNRKRVEALRARFRH